MKFRNRSVPGVPGVVGVVGATGAILTGGTEIAKTAERPALFLQ
jgi:hypothetical protein